MTTCDTCRHPGSCCKNFVLNRTYSRENWKKEATKDMKKNNLAYFVPLRPVPDIFDNPGETAVFFECTRLGSDGRCQDYEHRPKTCSRFEPQSDELCCEFVHKLKGIPIVTVEVVPSTQARRQFAAHGLVHPKKEPSCAR